MAQNKSNITPENMAEWVASTGFIFPRTMRELMRFEKLYSDFEINLEGFQIDPEKILGKKAAADVIQLPQDEMKEKTHFRMAARKGDSNIPQHILDKIKKNQDQRKKDDDGSKEKDT
ncbi:MAG: hypothetical protein ACTHK8_02940 [Ginsengibacter sp.]